MIKLEQTFEPRYPVRPDPIVGCSKCETFIRDFAKHAAEFREKEAIALLVPPNKTPSSLGETLPDAMIAGSDVGARSIRGFVGEDAVSAQGLERRAVFVADRHGESPGAMAYPGTRLRTIEQILSSLNLVEIAREECSVPTWPVDE